MSIAFLYNSNEYSEFKTENSIPFSTNYSKKEILKCQSNKIFARSICQGEGESQAVTVTLLIGLSSNTIQVENSGNKIIM